MNVNLAPVLDVYQAGNFIDRFERSYSSNPSTVSACGRAFIAATSCVPGSASWL
jgi:beta-N-acetylhexosaminidase